MKTRWIKAILSSALISALTSLAQNTALDQGVALIRAGKFDQALVKLEEAHRAAPRSATIENLLGITETQLGHVEDANTHYRAAMVLDSSMAAPHRNLGFNLLTAKNYAAAAPELHAASRLEPHDPFAHYYLCLLALATRQDADAVKESSLAGELPGHDAEVSTELAEAAIRAGDVKDAMRRVEGMEKASTISAQAEYSIAVSFAKSGSYIQAAHCFQRIATLDPSWQNRYNLALALLYANQASEAATILAALHAEQPANADILTFLGSSYEMREKMPGALQAYREAAAAHPSNPDRILDYTRLLMDTDRYDEAIAAVQRDMSASVTTAPLQLRLGAIEMIKGNYPTARAAFNTALATDSTLDAAYVGLAQTYAREANDAEALGILESAREKRPGQYLLEYYFGLLASRSGREQDALVALGNATRLQPSNPDPFFELGKLYESQQKWGDARRALERVIALNPASGPAHYQLSRVYDHLGMKNEASQEAQKTRALIDAQRTEVLNRQRQRAGSFQPQAAGAQSAQP